MDAAVHGCALFVRTGRAARSAIIGCVLLFLTGCAGAERTVTVYQEVYIPVKCTTPEPVKPYAGTGSARSGNVALMVHDLRRYAEEAILALRACKGE